MKKNGITALLCLSLFAALPATAFAQEVAVGGQIVGIQIRTDGVMVAGVGPVETPEGRRSPAADAGVKQGDFVTAINGESVSSAGELIAAVGALNGQAAQLTLLRADRQLNVSVQPVLSAEQQWMLGM